MQQLVFGLFPGASHEFYPHYFSVMPDRASEAPLAVTGACAKLKRNRSQKRSYQGKRIMAWTTPILVEICIGLEINGYLPAEF